MVARAATHLALVLLVAALLGCEEKVPEAPRPSSTATASAAPSPEETKKAIVEMIQSSQRQGIAGRDARAFLAIWSPEAKIIQARGPEPGPYDHVLSHAEIEKAAHARSKGKADAEIELLYGKEEVRLEGDRGTATWELETKWRMVADDASGVDRVAERYQLSRTKDGWRVLENRFWPLTTTYAGKTRRYQEEWTALDAAAEQATSPDAGPRADEVVQLEALMAAWRFEEGLALARKLTEATPGRGDGWQWRALFADRLRRIDETVQAYDQLRVIAPDARLPGWVEAELAERR